MSLNYHKGEYKIMKEQIRRGTFETNSSSMHSLTMCSEDTYEKWENGELLFYDWDEGFIKKSDIIEELKNEKRRDGTLYYPDVDWDNETEVEKFLYEKGILTMDQYFDEEYLECFEDRYITENGDCVIAFGKYGYNG